MTASLPHEIQDVFARFVTTEFTTIDGRGQPITWPLTPYYSHGDACIDVSTGLGYPKKANDARANPKVAMLFSDPTGSRLDAPPQVLVQGTADVDDRDLDANRERYERELAGEAPGDGQARAAEANTAGLRLVLHAHLPPRPPGARLRLARRRRDRRARRSTTRTWRRCARVTTRSRPVRHADTEGGGEAWDERMDELGDRYPSGRALPRGAGRLPVLPAGADLARPRRPAGSASAPGALGVPIQPGLACVTAHDHDPGLPVAAQLPGPRRPRRGGWRLGRDPPQAGGRLRASARVARVALAAERAEVPPLPLDRQARARQQKEVETQTPRLRSVPRWPKPPVRAASLTSSWLRSLRSACVSAAQFTSAAVPRQGLRL